MPNPNSQIWESFGVPEQTHNNNVNSGISPPSKEIKVTIPKIIMQTWKDNDLPDHWKESPNSFKKVMPGWKHVFMTDEDIINFIKENYPQYLSLYNSFEYTIMKIDYFRVLWLYHNGGIYSDMDFELQRPLDELFTNDAELYVVQSGNVGHVITNSFMAAKPKSPILKEYLDEMSKEYRWWAFGKHLKVMSLTGPLCFSRVLKYTSHVYSILPKSLMMPCSACDAVCDPGPEAYLKATKGCSWIGWDTKVYNFFNCNYKAVLVGIVVVIIAIISFFVIKWWNGW
jgi:mannosyltransferase OCH1-like enzyme